MAQSVHSASSQAAVGSYRAHHDEGSCFRAFGTRVALTRRMTRPRRSAPGIAFAAVRTGRFQSDDEAPRARPVERETFDIVAVGRNRAAKKRTKRVLEALGGAALLALALVPRGFVGVLLGVSGAALLLRGASGRSLGDTARLAMDKLGLHPESDQNGRVDQASKESFPASDSPAHSPSGS